MAVLRNLGCERALKLRIASALNTAVMATSSDDILTFHSERYGVPAACGRDGKRGSDSERRSALTTL